MNTPERLRLLIFAKYPRPGEVKTRLVPPLSFDESSALYQAFLLDALDVYDTLRPTVEPVLYLAAPNDREAMRELLRGTDSERLDIRVQQGAGLGQRLESAFAEAFADGCTGACAIGTDHPTLPLDYVRRALAGLGAYDLVIGPADDGGYYLLGLSAARPALLRGMPYSQPELYAATTQAARRDGLRMLELPLWYDVDDAGSLRRLCDDRGLLRQGSRTLAALQRVQGRVPEEKKTDGNDASLPLSS